MGLLLVKVGVGKHAFLEAIAYREVEDQSREYHDNRVSRRSRQSRSHHSKGQSKARNDLASLGIFFVFH